MDADKPKQKHFPKGFLWGASTAAHQVEGGTINQWTVWELAHASELAKTSPDKYPMAGRTHRIRELPLWPEIKSAVQDPANYVSGTGIDHYNRYKEDFDLVKQLNLNSFRFGIEWSRIEPEEGVWNQEAIDHYKDYIAELRSRKIEPLLNIWHFTLPTWFADKGGFQKRSNLKHWERFVAKVAEELLDGVSYVITINEPNVYATFGYLIGEHPPKEKNVIKFSKVYWHLALAHRKAYRILKQKKPELQIGLASQLANIQAKHPHNILDEVLTKVMRYAWNWWFFRRTREQQDFIGFNYYFTDYYSFRNAGKPDDPKVPISDLGWYMEPEGLYSLLMRTWSRYHKPIMVTENGLADQKDEYRQWWIEETIVAMERAISEGVEIKGYYHWSLLDNFEWAYGWWPKFGLIAVDREHGNKRTIRPSAKWFSEQIKRLS